MPSRKKCIPTTMRRNAKAATASREERNNAMKEGTTGGRGDIAIEP